MVTDVKLQAVYDRVKNLKQRFYETKTQEEWDECKKELVTVLDEAKELMTPDFFPKYRQGIVDSIAKIYSYKEKQFNKKQFVPQPKQSYIFREDEGQSFSRLCNALADFLEKKTKML